MVQQQSSSIHQRIEVTGQVPCLSLETQGQHRGLSYGSEWLEETPAKDLGPRQENLGYMRLGLNRLSLKCP